MKNNNIDQKRKVVLFVVDGLVSQSRSWFTDEIRKNDCEDLNFNYFNIRTVLPALPAVNLSSILTGVPLEFHCVTSFSGPDEEVTLTENHGFDLFPTIFWYLSCLKEKFFFFSDTKKAENIIEKELVKFECKSEFNLDDFDLKKVSLSKFSCFHFGSLFEEGKKNGFESACYQSKSFLAFQKIVALVKKFSDDKNFLFIVVSSCGGKGKGISSIGGHSKEEIVVPCFLLTKNKNVNWIEGYYDLTSILPSIAKFLGFNLLQPCSKNTFLEIKGDKERD